MYVCTYNWNVEPTNPPTSVQPKQPAESSLSVVEDQSPPSGKGHCSSLSHVEEPQMFGCYT